jgi:hypothetical protein
MPLMGEGRFDRAVAAFAAIDREDPRVLDDAGTTQSTRYHERVSRWIVELEPGACEALRLAGCCQHIRRWTIPRDRFVEGRAGYRRWRSTLARHHADTAAEVLRAAGYEEATIERVRDLLTKRRLRSDAAAQTLQDAVCLTFVELELAAFSAKHPPQKVREILEKTAAKMSAPGRARAVAAIASLAGAGAVDEGALPEAIRAAVRRNIG